VYQVTVSAKAPLVDLAVLQATRDVTLSNYLPLALGATAVVGERVFTVGYPAPGVLGLEPRFTEGTISSLSGLRGDASFLQVSVPIQPGNSGGALLDERGRVIGVVVSAAAPAAFLKNTGTLPQNINWAVKIAFATPLLSERPGTQAASRNTKIDREQVIARATAASCVVVAMRPAAPSPVRESVGIDGGGRGVITGVAGGVTGGVIGGVAGGVVGAPAPPPPPPPVRVSGDVKPPEKVKDVKPVYPDVAQAARVQGAVVLEVVIDPTGGIREAKVVRSIPLLDQAAIDAVKQWQFTPTQLNGRAVPVMMTVTVNFSLQ
jgi:TonB family protein